MRIRALIVDDEPLARRRIRAFLRTEADVFVVGECGDGESAARALRELKPDLIFLDVQMPGMDGFEVLRSLEGSRLPGVIFVTAYDQYAIRAFEEQALDYLLKPFSRARFQEAVRRARERQAAPDAAKLQESLLDLLRQTRARENPGAGLLRVKVENRIVLLEAVRIERIEAERDYVRICAGRDSYLTRETMNALESQLDPDLFLRVHRSTIVNIRALRELHQMPGGDYILIMRDGARVAMSRRYRSRAETLLKGSL